MLKEIIPLNVHMLYCIVQSRKTRLCASNSHLVCYDFVDEILLRHMGKFSPCVLFLEPPLPKWPEQRVVHSIDGKVSPSSGKLSRSNPPLPLIQSTRHDFEVTVLEDQVNHRSLHGIPLLVSFPLDEVIDLLRLVALLQEKIT